MRLQHLSHEIEIRNRADAQQDHRQVAGNGMPPQTGLRATVREQHGGFRAQARVGIQNRTCEPRVQFRVGFTGVELTQYDLTMCPRHVQHTIGERSVLVAQRERNALLARFGDTGDDVDRRALSRCKHELGASGCNRIEHGSDAAAERTALLHGPRRTDAGAATDEDRAIRFVRDLRPVDLARDHQMKHPRRALVARARPARAQDRSRAFEPLRLYEQLAERGMARIGIRRGQDHFGVAGHVELAGRARQIREADSPQLDIVFLRYHDLSVCVDAGVLRVDRIATAKFDAPFSQYGLGSLRCRRGRLVSDRPVVAAAHIADVAERAPVIARRILVPARDGQIEPAAVTAAGVRNHYVIATVREKLHFGLRRIDVRDHARRARHAGACAQQLRLIARQRFIAARLRHALLQ